MPLSLVGAWLGCSRRASSPTAISGSPALLASRPFLEGHIRELVRALPQVTVLDGRSAAGLTATADRRRITGVKVDGSTAIAAELVVDASGRGSRTGLWLTDLGYQAPAEDRIDIGLGYSTRSYRLRPGAVDGDALILTAGTPANPRTGVLAATEGGRHMVTLAGICGDYPPTDPSGFDEFLKDQPQGLMRPDRMLRALFQPCR
jgi:hypothetical protein